MSDLATIVMPNSTQENRTHAAAVEANALPTDLTAMAPVTITLAYVLVYTSW